MVRRILATALSLALACAYAPLSAFAQDAVSATADYSAKFSFSDTGIAVEETEGASAGYSISGTTLTITKAGTYDISGSCKEGAIEVKKGSADVVLVLDGLDLACSTTAPLVVKKGSTVSIHLADKTTSTLTDNEGPSTEDSNEDFEGAALKVKSDATSSSSVTFCGGGDLNVVANAKNGIKGGACGTITFNQSGTIAVSGSANYRGGTQTGAAVNNGIACDGSLVFNQGSFVVKAANDGIKSAPDVADARHFTTDLTHSLRTL